MSAQSIRSTPEPSRLGIAFVTALALHGAVLGGLTLWQSTEPDNPPGEQEITIDLAPALEEAVSVAPAEISAVDAPLVEPEEVPLEPETLEPLPPEEATAEQPEEVTALPEPLEAAEAAPVEAETEPTIALPPPETIIAKPLEEKPIPKPEKKPIPKPVERKPPPRRTVAQPQQPPSEARQGQASASRENMGGAAASADPAESARYLANLRATLRSRMRIPNALRSQGFNGSVNVVFTIDSSGRITSSSLVRSSGHPAADQAALAAASPGSSVPPAPVSVPQRTFNLPLVINIR